MIKKLFPRHMFLCNSFLCVGVIALLAGCASLGTSVERAQSKPSVPEAIALWPGGAPGSEGQTAPERIIPRHEAATTQTADVTFGVVTDIHNPSITPFLPDKAKATGAAVIIAPGGGHQFLSIDHEGYDVARYLADHGVAGFVLKYRLARTPNSPYKVDVHALMDAQRAIRLIRSRSGEWGIDPHRIGILGFSAGGEIAILAATRYEKPVEGSNDQLDRADCKPDFQALLYPGGLRDPATIPLTKETPPAFLCCTYTDRPNISANLASLYLAMKNAGVPAELHIYANGGHGFGVRKTGRPVASWPDRFIDWMSDTGLLKSK